jgi:hypothetical protein
MKQPVGMQIIGRCKIYNKNGDLILDKKNAIHPQNMARVIARALAKEDNYFIAKVALGNGGTQIDAVGNVLYNPPRDGLNPGDGGWEARLYNETYYEYVDESSTSISTGPGADKSSDPVTGIGVVSTEDTTVGSTVSTVTITMVLNQNEPATQSATRTSGPTNMEDNFVFDEIGIFSAGAPAVATPGYQEASIGVKTINDDTGLAPSTTYTFNVIVDGGALTVVSITTPASGSGDGTTAPVGAITYGDVISLLNAPGSVLQTAGAVAKITDGIPSQDGGVETYGNIRIESKTVGSGSSVVITDVDFFSSLSGFEGLATPVNGVDAGVRNDPTNSANERERMLAHLVFSPIEKTADDIFTIKYSFDIVIARSGA